MAEVTEVELTVPQGTTFFYDVTFLDKDNGNAPIDMTGWTSKLQARLKVADPDPAVYTATEQDDITLGNGLASLKVPAEVTALWSFSKVVFDWEVKDLSGNVYRLVKGVMVLDKEVTR